MACLNHCWIAYIDKVNALKAWQGVEEVLALERPNRYGIRRYGAKQRS